MQRHARLARERDEEFLGELGVERPDALDAGVDFVERLAAPRNIDARHDQGFIHGHERRAETTDAALVAEGLAKRAAHRDADVLDGMMVVYLHVAARLDIGAEAPVADEGIEHMVEKPHARVDARLGRAVYLQKHANRGFGRDAFDRRRPHDIPSFAIDDMAASTRSFSPGVPTVILRQSFRRGAREKSLARMEYSSRRRS